MEDKVMVGEKEFVIGKPSAAQVAGIIKVFSKLNASARAELKGVEKPTELDYMLAMISGIDEDGLITLAALSIGTDKQFARDNFDLEWVTEALVILIRNSNIVKVIANFTSMLSPAESQQGQSDTSATN